MSAPLIVTLLLEDAAQERFDRLRAAHFPAERNHLAAHVTLFHARVLSVAEAEKGAPRFEVFDLGRKIVSVVGTYGYMEQPDIRGALRELQSKGEIDIPSERWIIESGEEEIITSGDLSYPRWIRVIFFRLILRLSTPAHKFLGLGYDAGVSKEIIPVDCARTVPIWRIADSRIAVAFREKK